ncbi:MULTISPECIES: phosphatase [unclassified Oceanispirochaeta]|uniref:phosphatase n=1 Tax=unclassified Oceanispirochaeta TaxID=2635722 RepID=UPI000E095A27|nr:MULTISPECIES: phosphatase [unclassified Oceanispirochaeta]MBF9015991.1 phosphatase [Oceanispirochaeta sp. M2]NPD72454.1 phosphatase [Oceanispirochaeta sp. M1]RDG31913.1 phosphatase [Oceanispirochaeta sp. M1]
MIAIDTHTHSTASGHAYSTLEEMARASHEKGLTGFVLTDHSPGMPGGAHLFHFYNLRVLPREIHGSLIFRGAEANIINFDGDIDLDEEVMNHLEVVIASFHVQTCSIGTRDDHTNALLGAMNNPYVKILGHPDDSRFPYDIPAVVKAAGETATLIEMNNTSLSPHGFRVGALENYKMILSECRKQGVMITLGSDAHFSTRVGETNYCEPLLEELHFPQELIANTSLEKFLSAMKISL